MRTGRSVSNPPGRRSAPAGCGTALPLRVSRPVGCHRSAHARTRKYDSGVRPVSTGRGRSRLSCVARPKGWFVKLEHMFPDVVGSRRESLTGRAPVLLRLRRLRWRSDNSRVRRRRRGKCKSCLHWCGTPGIAIFETRGVRWGSLSVKPGAGSPARRPTSSSHGFKTAIPIRESGSRLKVGGTPPKSNSWAACRQNC